MSIVNRKRYGIKEVLLMICAQRLDGLSEKRLLLDVYLLWDRLWPITSTQI